MTYDPTTIAGKVRLLISDTAQSPIFTDTEIDAFLSLASSNIYRASALALRAIAGNEAQVLKRITLLDLTTDGTAVAKALMDLATSYEEQAKKQGSFAIAEFGLPPFGSKERLRNEWLRHNA